jgi:hypothetical protein
MLMKTMRPRPAVSIRTRRAASSHLSALLVVVSVVSLAPAAARAADTLKQYYAHQTVEDSNGVLAPWYRGQNGQFDERMQIAVDIYKRYPWTAPGQAVIPAPHIVYNTHWKIDKEGTISIPPTQPWMCGDLSQRAFSIIRGLTEYYRYSGDPMALVYVPIMVDYVLDYCVTGPDHPWPGFPIATPTKGIGYQKADPNVPNQLDLCAYLGLEVLRAYKFTGNPRYLEAARHWGDVFAEKCNLANPEFPPWNRYMSPEFMLWSDELTGSTTLIAEFLDALIDMGYQGKDGLIVKARDAGRAYLLNQILPRWIDNEAWGRHYWDVEGDWISGGASWICGYFMDHPDVFPNWKNDVRNVLSLVFNRNCADPGSRGEAYSGAWAIPESFVCCGTSLSYNQYTYAAPLIRLGEMAQDEWAREVGRRMLMMATYDSSERGVVLDGVAGDVVAAADWLNLAHPWPLCQILIAMEYRPELYGAARENHLMHTKSVVTSIVYDDGAIRYSTFDAPPGSVDILRLAFEPKSITADGKALSRRSDVNENGFTVATLPNGDCIVNVRHDGAREVRVTGDDPQEVVDDAALSYTGEWSASKAEGARQGTLHAASGTGASMSFPFVGNQVRIIGTVDDKGGLADVFVDGQKQLTCVDCWNPSPRHQQLLYRKGGLSDGKHEIRIVARGEKNGLSHGTGIYVDAVQYSAATGGQEFGEGGGPTGPQRLIMGYTGRKDYVDSKGQAWRPGTEFVVRLGYGVDTVARTWYTDRRSYYIGNTPDPELYRYGVHAKDFRVNLTAGPGKYRVRLHFADTNTKSVLRVLINGEKAVNELSIAKAAGGIFRAYKASFPGIEPKNGIIELRFIGRDDAEACVQAIEIEPEASSSREAAEK